MGTKTVPKNGTQTRPKIGPKSKLQNLQSVVYSAIQMSAANQELQPKKERKLGLTNLLKQRACVRLQAKHSQDMTPLQKIHSAVSRMGK